MVEADLNLSFSRGLYTKEHRRAEQRLKIGELVITDGTFDHTTDDVKAPVNEENDRQARLSPTDDTHVSTPSLVTYERFREEYWPHFPQHLTKGFGTGSELHITRRILT